MSTVELDLDGTLVLLRQVSEVLEQARTHPHGPEHTPDLRALAGQACVRLCEGDPDKGRTLWKLVVRDCGGYMPQAAAIALYRAANTVNLVPDVEAPDPT